MLALRVSGYRGNDIAAIFNTTRPAVHQRLYRLRTGFNARNTEHAPFDFSQNS
jgi:hypothetical protein